MAKYSSAFFTRLHIVLSFLIMGLIVSPKVLSATDGLFGTYFERMVGPCAVGSVLTGFDQTSGNYGTKTCVSLSTMLVSIFGTNTAPIGQSVVGFNTDGTPKFGSVNWLRNGDNISYLGGNVGIGVISPDQKLSVAGTIESKNGGFKFPDGTSQITASPWLRSGTTTSSTDNIGIGTNSPSAKLDVLGEVSSSLATASYSQFRAVAGNKGLMIRNDGTTSYFLLTFDGLPYGIWNELRPFYISNATGDVGLINGQFFAQHSTGRVGIGTQAPTVRLDVNGKIRMQTQTDSSDTPDTVATKGYVDSRASVGGDQACDVEGKIAINDGKLQRCFLGITYGRNIEGGWYSNSSSYPSGFPTCDPGDTETSRSACVNTDTSVRLGDRRYKKQNQITCKKPPMWKTWTIPSTNFQ